MNREIEMMIELQRCWDNVLKGRNGVEKSEESIANWNNELEAGRSAILSLEDEIKNDKSRIKQSEVELSGKDEQSKRLEDRRLIIKTEKELKALESELQKVNGERSELEDVLLSMMDDLEKKELDLKKMKAELEDLEKQVDNDTEMFLGRIVSFKKVISENQEKYEQILPELSPNVRARYTKLKIERIYFRELASKASRRAARKIAIIESNLRKDGRYYKRVLLDNVIFKKGSLDITKEGIEILDNIYTVLKLHPRSRIKIVGHTQLKDTNKTISKKKAESVSSHLKKIKRVKGWRVNTAGMGRDKPIEINGRMRTVDRVELVITGIR